MYGNQIVDLFGAGLPRLGDGLGARAVPDRRRRGPDRVSSRASCSRSGWRRNEQHRAVAERRAACCAGSSRSSSLFLYAPILILLIFSFNDSDGPVVPAQRVHACTGTASSSRTATCGRALWTSAIIAAVTSVGAVILGVLSSIALAAAVLPRQAGRLGAAAQPARDPVPRVRDRAAAPVPSARRLARHPDGGDRAHRDHAAVHDPRARAAARADRGGARGGGLRPRREPPADVPARSRSR